MPRLNDFEFEGQLLPVKFQETLIVKEGVECDVYSFINDDSKDLAIVRVASGHKTPLQRVLQGRETVEGLVSGKGALTVQSKEGSKVYIFRENGVNQPVRLEIGQIVQWEADHDVGLVFFEVCDPPYTDGRFENLSE